MFVRFTVFICLALASSILCCFIYAGEGDVCAGRLDDRERQAVFNDDNFLSRAELCLVCFCDPCVFIALMLLFYVPRCVLMDYVSFVQGSWMNTVGIRERLDFFRRLLMICNGKTKEDRPFL